MTAQSAWLLVWFFSLVCVVHVYTTTKPSADDGTEWIESKEKVWKIYTAILQNQIDRTRDLETANVFHYIAHGLELLKNQTFEIYRDAHKVAGPITTAENPKPFVDYSDLIESKEKERKEYKAAEQKREEYTEVDGFD